MTFSGKRRPDTVGRVLPGDRHADLFAPVNAPRAFEAVVEQLVLALTSGRVEIGDALPSERDLAEIIGVSRPTVRQAVRALAEAGAIEVRRGSGKGIRVLSTDPPTEVIRRAADWRREEFAHFYEARRAMEPALFALAAARISEPELEAIEAELAREVAARVDPERWPVFGLRLLRMIFRAAASPVLEHAAIRTLLRAAPGNDLFQPTEELLQWAVDRDRASVAAIRSRDPVRARSAAEARLDEWYEQLQHALDANGVLDRKVI
jgi:DNA-binding FadR family transcriptional regulator